MCIHSQHANVLGTRSRSHSPPLELVSLSSMRRSLVQQISACWIISNPNNHQSVFRMLSSSDPSLSYTFPVKLQFWPASQAEVTPQHCLRQSVPNYYPWELGTLIKAKLMLDRRNNKRNPKSISLHASKDYNRLRRFWSFPSSKISKTSQNKHIFPEGETPNWYRDANGPLSTWVARPSQHEKQMQLSEMLA